MNACDYFFEHSRTLEKDFILGPVEPVSFRSLYEQTVNVAAALRQAAGSGQNVILIASNSVFMVTAYLAIIKSGNVAVPLNPEIEQGNLNFIQEKCRAGIVIMQGRLKEKLNVGGAVVWDESMLNSYASVESFQPFPEVTPSGHLAEIVFTSGSTGEPKGVMITHGNLIANTQSIIE